VRSACFNPTLVRLRHEDWAGVILAEVDVSIPRWFD